MASAKPPPPKKLTINTDTRQTYSSSTTTPCDEGPSSAPAPTLAKSTNGVHPPRGGVVNGNGNRQNPANSCPPGQAKTNLKKNVVTGSTNGLSKGQNQNNQATKPGQRKVSTNKSQLGGSTTTTTTTASSSNNATKIASDSAQLKTIDVGGEIEDAPFVPDGGYSSLTAGQCYPVVNNHQEVNDAQTQHATDGFALGEASGEQARASELAKKYLLSPENDLSSDPVNFHLGGATATISPILPTNSQIINSTAKISAGGQFPCNVNCHGLHFCLQKIPGELSLPMAPAPAPAPMMPPPVRVKKNANNERVETPKQKCMEKVSSEISLQVQDAFGSLLSIRNFASASGICSLEDHRALAAVENLILKIFTAHTQTNGNENGRNE